MKLFKSANASLINDSRYVILSVFITELNTTLCPEKK